MLQKIVVIGSPGSGKSYFSNKLGEILSIEVNHLDDHYWDEDWLGKDDTSWFELQNQLLNEDEFIIDGNYLKSLENRIEEANVVILLDRSLFRCIYGISKRTLKNAFGIDVDLPVKIKSQTKRKINQNGFWDFVLYVINFHKNDIKKTREMLYRYRDSKVIVTIRNDKEMSAFLRQVRVQRSICKTVSVEL